MCTTMMVLTTIAVILRQRFSNKIKPNCLEPFGLDDVAHGYAFWKTNFPDQTSGGVVIWLLVQSTNQRRVGQTN
uniref:Uncharacterized protein n=1 Tax=Fundulus heteroclitus TaxID=8078 RepID=A0A3Q2TF35_FUNHE